MTIALISTTYNCATEVDEAIAYFSKQEQLQLVDEIIVVDGGSTDGTFEKLQLWEKSVDKVKVLLVPDANISKGRNEAISHARSDIIVCFDSGCYYENNWLSMMTLPFRDSKVDIVGCSTKGYGLTNFELALANLYDNKTKYSERGNPSHRGIAYRKDVWRAVGGYPEIITAGEDTWFNSRWQRLGFNYRFVKTTVFWRVRSTGMDLYKMHKRNTKGHMFINAGKGILTYSIISTLVCSIPLTAFFYLKISAIIFFAYILLIFYRLYLTPSRRCYFNKLSRILHGFKALIVADLGITCGILIATKDKLKASLTNMI